MENGNEDTIFSGMARQDAGYSEKSEIAEIKILKVERWRIEHGGSKMGKTIPNFFAQDGIRFIWCQLFKEFNRIDVERS